MFMNQNQEAWVKAIEKKLGTEVNVKDANDIRMLARLATGTNGGETLAQDDKT